MDDDKPLMTYGQIADELERVAKADPNRDSYSFGDPMYCVHQLREFDRRANLADDRTICDECDEEINKFAPYCPECGDDRTR